MNQCSNTNSNSHTMTLLCCLSDFCCFVIHSSPSDSFWNAPWLLVFDSASTNPLSRDLHHPKFPQRHQWWGGGRACNARSVSRRLTSPQMPIYCICQPHWSHGTSGVY